MKRTMKQTTGPSPKRPKDEARNAGVPGWNIKRVIFAGGERVNNRRGKIIFPQGRRKTSIEQVEQLQTVVVTVF